MSIDIVGRLTADPEVKVTNNGTSVCNFSVAVNRKKGEEEYTSFFDCTAWGSVAENIGASLRKGDRVVVVGNMNQDRYERDGKTVSKYVLVVEAIGPDLRFATASPSGTAKKSDSGHKYSAPEEDF
jgi:single-strand DNA-binding protein